MLKSIQLCFFGRDNRQIFWKKLCWSTLPSKGVFFFLAIVVTLLRVSCWALLFYYSFHHSWTDTVFMISQQFLAKVVIINYRTSDSIVLRKRYSARHPHIAQSRITECVTNTARELRHWTTDLIYANKKPQNRKPASNSLNLCVLSRSHTQALHPAALQVRVRVFWAFVSFARSTSACLYVEICALMLVSLAESAGDISGGKKTIKEAQYYRNIPWRGAD